MADESPTLTVDEQRVLVTLYRWLYGVYKWTGTEPKMIIGTYPGGEPWTAPAATINLEWVPWYRLFGVLCLIDGDFVARWEVAAKALTAHDLVDSWQFLRKVGNELHCGSYVHTLNSGLDAPLPFRYREDPARHTECWRLANERDYDSYVRFTMTPGGSARHIDYTYIDGALLDEDGVCNDSVVLQGSGRCYYLPKCGFAVARELHFAALEHAPWQDVAAGAGDGSGFVATKDDRAILIALRDSSTTMTQVDIEQTTSISRKTIGTRLKILEAEKVVSRPNGPRAGYALTGPGRTLLAD